jgi:hypothetical protein
MTEPTAGVSITPRHTWVVEFEPVYGEVWPVIETSAADYRPTHLIIKVDLDDLTDSSWIPQPSVHQGVKVTESGADKAPLPRDKYYLEPHQRDFIADRLAWALAEIKREARRMGLLPEQPAPRVQVWRDGWTALNSKGRWQDLREATSHEIALAAEHQEGFWLPWDERPAYYALGAKVQTDRLARVVTPEA